MSVKINTPYLAVINASSSGANVLVAGQPGQAIRVLRYALKVASAVTVTWESSEGTALSGPMLFASAGDGVIEPDDPDGYFTTTQSEGLTLNLSSGVGVGGYFKYEYV